VVCEKLRPFTGCSFGALLLDPETDLTVIETIKVLHKRQAESTVSESRQAVATAIYYAAIASALVHHDVRITKLSYESLGRSFEELVRSNWLPPGMKQLFVEAHNSCIRHMEKSGE
jgi:predicted RNase H-like nuclease (RuvC/YqgF family)